MTTPNKTKQIAPAAKTQTHEGSVVVQTGAFNVSTPVRIDAAETEFRKQVKDIHGDVVIEGVRFIKVNHHVGTSATYYFEATFTPSIVQAEPAPQVREG